MFKQKNNMPTDITLFLILLIVLQIYYFFIDFFISGIYTHYGHSIETLGIPSGLLLIFIFTILAITLYLITKGFLDKTKWARKFTMAYLIWTSLWTIWGIIIGASLIFHIVLLIVYLLMIYYLTTENVKEYFKKVEIFTYGPYTLYKRIVELKSGKTVTIHFFSKHKPHSGTPTSKPEGYEVGINPRSNLPYLYKTKNHKPETQKVFTYKDYTLYKRTVDLKSGKTVTIHFFSKHKPHSGTPTSMPDGYEVGINPRSNLPYLYKKENKKTKKQEPKNQKTEENNHRKPSNVIYVVSKPQPGQVKGDWAVRGHGKIYSHHRTKKNAIKQARKIAKEKQSTVLVQNTDGTFRQSFKPRPNKA